jgi:integrase
MPGGRVVSFLSVRCMRSWRPFCWIFEFSKVGNRSEERAGRHVRRSAVRFAKTRERLAEWMREIGVGDPELRPNHAWRHTFKKIGDRSRLTENMLDAICGHAQASVGL